MKALSSSYPVQRVAEVLEVPRASLYRAGKPSARAEADAILLAHILRIFNAHKRRYGSPRVALQLRKEGHACGRKRVARLMRRQGLQGITSRRKHPGATDSSHNGPIAPNLLKNLVLAGPNQAWAMDITYVRCGAHWVYLAAVLDLFLHKIVGWDLGETLHASLACAALCKAMERQGFPKGVKVHSDRGCQYASREFIGLCADFACIRSMSGKGNCYDNAAMESFFGVLKREELDLSDFHSPAEVRAQVFEYIEAYYNRARIHGALGMTPLEFEAATMEKTPSAEFSEAWDAPQVGKEKAGERTPRPRPTVASPGYPLAGCSPAGPASVSPDSLSIHHNPLEDKHRKEYLINH